MISKTIVLGALLLLLGKALSGQILLNADGEKGQIPDPDRYFASLYFSATVPQFAGLHTGYGSIFGQLENQGIELEKLHDLWSFAIGGRLHRFYAEIYATTQPFEEIETFSGSGITYHVDDHFSAIGFQLGYALHQGRILTVLPRFGVGQSTYTIQKTGTTLEAALDFGEIENPTGTVGWPVLRHQQWYGDVSLELLTGRPNRKVSFMESVRLGYRFGLDSRPWETLGAIASNAPNDRLGQFYLSLNFSLSINYEKK